MKTPSKLLLLCILELSTASSGPGPRPGPGPAEESSCGTLAKARGAIPGDALIPRYFLHMFHKMTRVDICKKSFQNLPASTFLLAEDLTIGTFLQQWARTMEDFLWENWVWNHSGKKIKFTWDVDNMINHTMYAWEKQIGYTVRELKEKLGKEININAKEIESMVKNTFSFSKDDFVAFAEDLTCHFRGSVKHSELENFIKADGVETIDDNNLKAVLQTTQIAVLAETSDLLGNMVGKLGLLLEKFQPEMKAYEKTMLQLQSGNNPELENLILRILQEIQTHKFLERLDTFGKNSCMDIGRYTTTVFMNLLSSLETLSRFLGTYVNKNNKLDLETLVTDFNNNFGQTVKTYVYDIPGSRFADFEVGLKNGDFVFQRIFQFLPIVFPACSQFQNCENEIDIITEQADVLVGGAFRAFVKKFRIFRQSTRTGEAPACQVDCAAKCRDMNRDEYDPDGPGKMCMSKMGCNKNLFFDPEC